MHQRLMLALVTFDRRENTNIEVIFWDNPYRDKSSVEDDDAEAAAATAIL